MAKRFVSIWFNHLITDWFSRQEFFLRDQPFVVSLPVRGRMLLTAVNAVAESQGIYTGMVLADARALLPSLQVRDDRPDLAPQLLERIGQWCIRFTPFVAVDLPDGLIFDATGCSHLWGSEKAYLNAIEQRLTARGYQVRVAMADTIGAAWALARFGGQELISHPGNSMSSLLALPVACLRLDRDATDRLQKLGLREVSQLLCLPRSSLARRFGAACVQRIRQALGETDEVVSPVITPEAYQEWLPCLEPIVTATGIEMALQFLLKAICQRLQAEEKGLRAAVLKAYRLDGRIEQISIGTNRPSHHETHLFKLFEIKIATIEPDLGIELFVLEATGVQEHKPVQEKLWETATGLNDLRLSELVDRLILKTGPGSVFRYLPAEHYWPERSVSKTASLQQTPAIPWPLHKPRPVQLLARPQRIEVMAPVPDYPPMHFRYQHQLYKIVKADGPERIEQEWWLEQGEHRDYYVVEDEQGNRYWLFRLGHYSGSPPPQWFIHGFFA